MDDKTNLFTQGTVPVEAKPSRLAIASFVSGVLTLAGLVLGNIFPPLVFLFLAFPFAVVLGHLARRAFRRRPGKFSNEAMATYGLTLGYLGLFLTVVVVGAMLLGFTAR